MEQSSAFPSQSHDLDTDLSGPWVVKCLLLMQAPVYVGTSINFLSHWFDLSDNQTSYLPHGKAGLGHPVQSPLLNLSTSIRMSTRNIHISHLALLGVIEL